MCKLIEGNIEEILVLNCGEKFDFILGFCGESREAKQVVISFNDFDELYVKGHIDEDTYNLYRKNDIVEIIAQK